MQVEGVIKIRAFWGVINEGQICGSRVTDQAFEVAVVALIFDFAILCLIIQKTYVIGFR